MLPADWFSNWFKPHEIAWKYHCVKYDDVNILRSLPLATLKGMKWTTKEIEIWFVKCMQKMNLLSLYSTAQAKCRWKHVFSIFIRWMWSRLFAIYIYIYTFNTHHTWRILFRWRIFISFICYLSVLAFFSSILSLTGYLHVMRTDW